MTEMQTRKATRSSGGSSSRGDRRLQVALKLCQALGPDRNLAAVVGEHIWGDPFRAFTRPRNSRYRLQGHALVEELVRRRLVSTFTQCGFRIFEITSEGRTAAITGNLEGLTR